MQIRHALTAIALGCSVLITGLSAFGGSKEVVYDSNGIPRCIPHLTKNDALIIYWNENVHYPRKMYGTPMSELEGMGGVGGGYTRDCNTWKFYESIAKRDMVWERMNHVHAMPATGPSFTLRGVTYSWSGEVEARLAKIRAGANFLRPDDLTGAKYLAQYPIENFTRETNRELSYNFGVGFTADVFKAWLEQRPGNRAFKAEILKSVARAKASGSGSLRAKLAGYKILIAQGYMQTPQVSRLQPLVDILRSLGADVTLMDSDSVAPLSYNIPLFKQQIQSAAAGNKRLILMAASKGAPELLTAVALLNSESSQFRSKLAAVITLAGMIDGSFLPDWAAGFPQRMMVKGALEQGAKASGLEVASLDGFFDMSTDVLRRQSQVYRRALPNVRYYSFVGVITGTGLARDKEISMLQQSISIPFATSHGANDGYIEYPGTAFPRAWGLRSKDVVFDSSHAILDGFYNGHDLQNEKTRKYVIQGIFQTILDELAQSAL